MKTNTQKQMAEKAGITAQHLSYILNQKRHVSVMVAKKLAEISQELGLPFTPEDWVFRPEIIKQHLKETKQK
jgi:transcriptional regulator with XRE-family HTH domain